MSATPDRRGDDRGQEAPGSFDPSAVLREMVNGCQLPSDDEPPAEPEACLPGPDGPRFTLPELVDQEAMAYRAWGTPVGYFLARHMEELARSIRWTEATNPEDHEARIEVMEVDLRERWWAIGFEEARRQCRCSESPVD